MKRRLKWYLMFIQVVVTLSLALWGNAQTQRLLRQRGTFYIVDYVAPAELVMHVINAPASVICAATFSRSFQIGLEYSRWSFGLYIVLVAVLWFFVGCIVQNDSNQTIDSGRWSKIGWGGGVILSLAFFLVGLAMLTGPWSIIISFATVIWSIAFLVTCCRRLLKHSKSGNTDKGPDAPLQLA